MSVNISLGDAPGVSAYFDGQPIQDELEEEIRREEQRQEKELRDLLATELEDFEEDFLSDSNSEDDSVNVSRVSRASSHSHRIRQNEQSKALEHASSKLVQRAPDSTGNIQHSDIADSANEAYFSPVSQRSHPVFTKPQGLLHKHQQNLLQQQQQQLHHPHHQQDQQHPYQHRQDVIQNHQGQFVQYDNISHSHGKDEDDWMMKVQQTHAVSASTSSPYQQSPHHHHHRHHHQHQQQHQQQQQFFSPLSQPVNTVVDNGPLPIPNHLRNLQQKQQLSPHSPVVKSPSSQPTTPKSLPIETSTPILSTALTSVQAIEVPSNTDDFDNYQVQYKSKAKKGDVNENDFYIQNENVEFFKAEGSEEKRSYQQLEVLYRARGRELEDLTWKLKQSEEDAAKDVRMYKHKLALANGDLEGGQESLRHCQSLLQQTKSDLTESQALVRSLETQVSSLKEAKEELIKKLQVAESTIENLSHQCEELQQSESLSRARNEHENVVASLTQRFERELLSVKEKLDETKSNLESKHDETIWLKKQLADSTKELEQAQISRGETINRLAKSLEDSQRQCQTLLEQSSSQEMASLKVKLQQTIASKSVSEETCIGLQHEIKELKEQLSMFETASALGAVSSSTSMGTSHNKMGGTGLDDSMTDLGIKKTLDFDTPSSTPKLADTSSLEDLVRSLRSELEKCLHSNRQKRSEIAEKAGEIQALKQELQISQNKGQDLEKMCADQKSRLKDLDSMMSTNNGESIVEVRLRRDLDSLTKEKAILLEDIEDYKKRLEEVGASEAKLTEINTELSAQIAQMVSDFDSDKAAALDRCQRTLEEVNRMTLNNMRTELEDRLASEKSMVAECHKMELERMKEQIKCAQEEAHSVKTLYIQTCDEMKKQDEEARLSIRKELEEELASVSRCKEEMKETAMVQEEKKKRLCLEENFAKEKESWDERKNLYEREIKASKDIIADMKSSHENDVKDLKETISKLKCQHEEEMNALDDRLADLMSRHQDEMKKLQEVSAKNEEMKTHFESKLELAEKLHKAEKEELKNLLHEERKLNIDAPNSETKKSVNDVSILTSFVESSDISVQTDGDVCVEEVNKCENEESSLSERLAQKQLELESTKEEHLAAVQKLRIEHKKEFDKAARNREEKFQVELRYFLKDKDDKFKEKLDLAVKKCEEGAKLEYENLMKEKQVEIEDLKKELDSLQLSTTSGSKGTVADQENEITAQVIEKLNTEKSVMERKIEGLEQGKKIELSSLIEKHTKEEKALIERYTNEIEILVQKHKEECAELRQKIKELENSLRNSCENDDPKDKEEVNRVLSARVRDERARWFKEAQDYINNEIESGIAERERHGDDSAWRNKLNEEVKKNVETELDRMKNMMELEIEEEVNQRLREQLAREVKKLKAEREEKERDNKKLMDMQVKQKLSVEMENLKVKFLSELEARVEQEKENMRKKFEGDKETFVAQMKREMNMKVSEEKRKAEAEMMQNKQDELRQMRNEMEEEMRKRIERAKMDWKKEGEDWETNEGGRGIEDIGPMRDRLRAAEEACNKAYMERERAVQLLKRREAAYKEDKQKLIAGLKQLRQDFNASKEEQAALEEKIAQMDVKSKDAIKEAKRKKDIALEKLQARCDEEKEKLIMDYKNCMASMKEDFNSEVDRVKSEAEMERAAVLMDVRSHTERALTLSPLQEPDSETTTLFELRDHYLETVTKIKEDVMNHVQAANSRAAVTMKSEMRKQRRRLVQVFRERCKASIRSILTGQVPPNVLNALEHAIDVIAEGMVTTPKSATSTSSTISPSIMPALNAVQRNITQHSHKDMNHTKTAGDRYKEVRTRPERGDKDFDVGDNILRETGKASNPHHSSENNSRSVDQEWSQPLKSHPQLAKVDLYDSEAIDSSPQTSHHSSPASITLRSRSILHNTNQAKSSPSVPHLDLSPFHTPIEAEQSMRVSKEQKRHQEFNKGHSSQVKENRSRPHSAEATMKMSKSHNTPSDLPQNNSKSKSKFDNTGDVRSSDEPSPRDRMKMIEAQVRLANWAASGEMPWKGSGSKGKVDQRKGGCDEENEENIFVRPGKEAELFLKAQRSMKKKEGDLVTPMKIDRVESKASSQQLNNRKRLTELDGYMTDESSVSNGSSHSSFVTLEPDSHPRSQPIIQDPKGKHSAMSRKECGEVKSAAFENSEKRFLNVTQRITAKERFGFSSDDENRSMEDDIPKYKGLPTSTPAKKPGENREHYSKSHYGSKNMYEKQTSTYLSNRDRMDEGDNNGEQEVQGWKNVNAFSEQPPTRALHRVHRQEKRSYSQPRPSKSQSSNQRGGGNAKSIDFEFADISEITQSSEDLLVGGGMWRYKSLEDLLPHQAKVGVAENYNMKKMTITQNAPPPIRAMNSDFWREQSLEDEDDDDSDDYDRRMYNPYGKITPDHQESQQIAKHQQTHHPHLRQKSHSPANRNIERSGNNNEYDPSFARSRKDHHSNAGRRNFNPSSEPSWSKKQFSNTQSYSSPSFPTESQSRHKKSQPQQQQQQHNVVQPSYSSQFDAHVDDLRKSLETLEANPFSSQQRGKSKMKRSVSEQSLHTIQWDQDRSADIDELVNAYTSGGQPISHFDLHNFGNEEDF